MAYQFTIDTISSILLFYHFYAQMPCFRNFPWKWLPWINPQGSFLFNQRICQLEEIQRFNQQRCLHVSFNIYAGPCILALTSLPRACLDPLNKVTEHLKQKKPSETSGTYEGHTFCLSHSVFYWVPFPFIVGLLSSRRQSCLISQTT